MIYVDYSFGKWCHMCADSMLELHEFAKKLNLKREWFQDKKNRPHYDLTLSKKKIAIKNGAIELTRKNFLLKMIELYGE